MIVKKVFEALDFVVIAEPESHHVDYKIYDIVGYGLVAGVQLPLYEVDLNNETAKIEDACVFAHGFVKWDGCSNWHFDAQEEGMIHGCSRDDIERIGKILAECWNWTVELCFHSACSVVKGDML